MAERDKRAPAGGGQGALGGSSPAADAPRRPPRYVGQHVHKDFAGFGRFHGVVDMHVPATDKALGTSARGPRAQCSAGPISLLFGHPVFVTGS